MGMFCASSGLLSEVAGADTGACVLVMMDLPVWLLDMYANASDVTMKTTAATVVALLKNVEAPVLPKRDWLDPPPKAAPISPPLPV